MDNDGIFTTVMVMRACVFWARAAGTMITTSIAIEARAFSLVRYGDIGISEGVWIGMGKRWPRGGIDVYHYSNIAARQMYCGNEMGRESTLFEASIVVRIGSPIDYLRELIILRRCRLWSLYIATGSLPISSRRHHYADAREK